jgi:Zn-dependent protease with chaperone function
LDLNEHPRLAGVLAEVAQKVGTRSVDKVFLTPGTDIAVFERGSVSAQIGGRAERCLILGAGVLEGMKIPDFKAILAHEHGHFSNRDTAGGGLALAVRRSLLTMALSLARSGAAHWYNPAWLFVTNFYKVFLRISHGASRLQEVLADRWAAFSYGSAAFVSGLRHVIERSVRFDAHVNTTLTEVIDRRRPLANLYRYTPDKETNQADLARAVREAIDADPDPYDSHPAPRDRIAWVEELAVEVEEQAHDGDAWSLLDDGDALQEALTAQVRENLAEAQGVHIASA